MVPICTVIVSLLLTACEQKASHGSPDSAAQRADARDLRIAIERAKADSLREVRLENVGNRPTAASSLRHGARALIGDTEALAKATPSGAIAVGMKIRLTDGRSETVRDVNNVTVSGVAWGFVYRTWQGHVLLQASPAAGASAVFLDDINQLPLLATVTPLRRGDVQLASSQQIIAVAPRAHEVIAQQMMATP